MPQVPNSNELEFLKRSFEFVKIRLIQLGFLNWKHIGFLIKHCKPNEFIKIVLNCHAEIANEHKVFVLRG